MPIPEAATEEIRIAAASDEQSQLLAQIYAHGFERFGRDATILTATEITDPFGPLDTREANFTLTCTGKRVEEVLPEKATEFEQEAAADPEVETKLSDQKNNPSEADSVNPENKADKAEAADAAASGNGAPVPATGSVEFRDEVYASFLGTLPGEYAAGPRGMAQSCAKSPKLNIPYDIVAVYTKPTVSDYLYRYLLSPIGGWLSQTELDKMTEEAKKGADPAVLAALFLDEYQIHP